MSLALAIESPMSRREREKSRSRNRALKKGQANAAKRGTEPKTTTQPPPDRFGLDWMLNRKKITQQQARDGRRYGEDYRAAQIDGLVPLRSCLGDNIGGGGGIGLPPAAAASDARQRLSGAHAALSYQSDLIAACDLICGKEKTPWDVIRMNGGTQREAEQLVTTLRIALDILGKHYRR